MGVIMNKKELKIISVFRNNARENLTTASRKLNVPISTLYDKLKKYKGTVITKHTALLDFDKLGFKLKVIMSFKVPIENKEVIQKFLERHHRVNTVYKISNKSDFLIETIFKDLIELSQFSEKLEKLNIKEKQEFYVIKDIKREAFLSDQISVDLIADE